VTNPFSRFFQRTRRASSSDNDSALIDLGQSDDLDRPLSPRRSRSGGGLNGQPRLPERPPCDLIASIARLPCDEYSRVTADYHHVF